MTSRLAASVPVDTTLPADTSVLATYEAMLVLRRFQEKVGLLVAMGLIAEPPSSVVGNEPACVALAQVREPGEFVIAPSSESVFLALALGAPAASLFAEALGDNRADRADLGLICAPGASAAMSAAQELAAKGSCAYLSVCSRKVEASDLAQHLAASVAGRLPLVTVLSVPAEDISIGPAAAIDHTLVDGLDVARVENAIAAAAEKARQGGGPTLVIVRTPAFQGHVVAAGRAGGSKGPAREESDPVARLRRRILEDGSSDETALKSSEKTIREAIARAATDARGACDLSC